LPSASTISIHPSAIRMSSTPNFRRIALVSLTLNAGLIGWLLFAGTRDPSSASSQPISPQEPAAQKSDESESANRQAPASVPDAGMTDWKEALRQSSIPRHAFIAAVQADFDEEWNQRDEDLRKRYTNGEVEVEDLALLNVDREIALEAAMREALGEDAFREWDRQRKFADVNISALTLSEGEANKLHAIRTGLTDRYRALERSKLKKEIDPATYDDLYELAQADYEQELRNLVGFERFSEAKDSGITAYLRRDLRGLGVSESQFAQIRDLEGSIADSKADLEYEVSAGLIDSAKLDHERQIRDNMRDEQLQQILGEQAYALYRKQQDPRYQTMIDFAKDWRLADQDVESAYQLIHAHEVEVRRTKLAAYAAGRTHEEVQEQVSGLQARLSESLLQALTPEQVEKLRRNGVVTSE